MSKNGLAFGIAALLFLLPCRAQVMPTDVLEAQDAQGKLPKTFSFDDVKGFITNGIDLSNLGGGLLSSVGSPVPTDIFNAQDAQGKQQKRVTFEALKTFVTNGLNLGGIGVGSSSLPSGTTESSDIARMQYYFQGQGPVGIMAVGMNNAGVGTFGSCQNAANMCERYGPAYYYVMRQIATNQWFGYELDTQETSTNVSPPNLRSYNIYKPMKRVRFDNASCSDGDGGAVNIPIQAAQLWIKCNVGTTEPNATRLGLIFGLGSANDSYVRVTITNAAGTSFTPNLLPTAQNCVDCNFLTNLALIANGGNLAPTDRVISTEIAAIGTSGTFQAKNNHVHVPIADGLAPGAYFVTVEFNTNQFFGDATASDRFYLAYFTYGTTAMSDTDSGAKLEKMDYWTGYNDGSANETTTLLLRPTGTGSYVQTGGDHGQEFNYPGSGLGDPVLKVDGTQIYIHSRSSQRGITNNVAYITTATPHGITTGDLVTVTAMGSTSYNIEGATATNISSTLFSYAKTAVDEVTTADTAGRVIRHNFVKGTNAVTIDRTSKWLHTSYGGGTNPIVLMTQRYTVDKTGLRSDYTYQPQTVIDIQSSSYPDLMSTWKGDGLGPQFPAMSKWRQLGTVTNGIFVSTNSTDITTIIGQAPGFVVWSSTTGKASVIYSEEPAFSSFYWANGANWYLQDRAGNFLDKIYFQQITQNGTLTGISTNTVFTGHNRRLDAIFSNADAICQ